MQQPPALLGDGAPLLYGCKTPSRNHTQGSMCTRSCALRAGHAAAAGAGTPGPGPPQRPAARAAVRLQLPRLLRAAQRCASIKINSNPESLVKKRRTARCCAAAITAAPPRSLTVRCINQQWNLIAATGHRRAGAQFCCQATPSTSIVNCSVKVLCHPIACPPACCFAWWLSERLPFVRAGQAASTTPTA